MSPASNASQSIRVLHYFAFPGGGIGRYVHELLTRAVDQPNLDVELACIPSFHLRSQARYPLWPELRETTHPSPLRRRLRFAINLFVNPLRAIRRAKATGAQILHLSSIPHVTFALWSKALKKAKLTLVATAHDVRRSWGLIYYPYEIRQLKKLYQTCSALFVHSQFQKDDLVAFAGVSPDKVYVVPHGPYYYGPPEGDKITLRQRFGIPIDRKVALFFGDIRPDKNLDLFLKAMVPFRDQLFLLVAGQPKSRSGDIEREIRSLIAELGLAPCVLWHNWYIGDSQVANYFEACDFVALPYSARFTSQSGVLNVAMAYRRPVLITATPTVSESINGLNVAVTVEPDHLESLQSGIHRMLEEKVGDPVSFERYLSANSWDRNLEITTTVYRECLRKR